MITSAGEVEGTVGVREGRIVAVEPLNSDLDAERVIELGLNQVLLPGLVTPTCTSTTPAAPSGRRSGPPPRGGRRWRHHARRHAPQQPAADRGRDALEVKRKAAEAGYTSTWVLGRRGAGQPGRPA